VTGEERHQRMDAARIHAHFTVQDLWLRYVGLGGTGDAFDLDGYLQGLMPLEAFQEEVLAQAVNDVLLELYNTYNIAPTGPTASAHRSDDHLRTLVKELLDQPFSADSGPEPPGSQPGPDPAR
jgi:hypothetical protein